jgi:dihydroorotate dehydrogenase electron transfer subunit
VGIRGPFGTSFKLKGKRIALVAGGFGAGPLSFLAYEGLKKDIACELIIGARNKESLLYLDKKFPQINAHFCSDDGSYGYKGFTTGKLT